MKAPFRSFVSVALLSLAVVFGLTAVASASHRTVSVSTSVELRDALSDAQTGDVIELAPGSYTPMGPSGQLFLVISDPAVEFTVRAEVAGTAIIDGGLSRRLMEFAVSSPGLAGWVTFDGLVFRNGSTTTIGNAGGLTLRGARATFLDCTFEDNRAIPNVASGPSAGAVHIGSASDVQFIDCEFLDNTTDSHGGGMLVGGGSRVVIHDSLFEGNLSNIANHRSNSLGGAIHAFNSEQGTTTRLSVSNTRFKSNEAGFVGGAIQGKGNFVSATQAVASPTEIVVSNCTFEDNLAESHPAVTTPSPNEGGAIMAEDNVDVYVMGSRFWNNQGGFGGAISMNRALLDVETSEFRGNIALGRASSSDRARGGAINAHSNDSCADLSFNNRSSSVAIRDSFFENNSAQSGGCVYVVGDRTRMFGACQTGTLAENRAQMTLENVVLTGCSVDDAMPNHGLGGALYGSLVDLDLSQSMILDSEALGTDPSNPSSTSKGFGGGATFRTGSLVRINDNVFAGNSADHEGGGLHLFGSEIDQFSNNTFIANVVSPAGGRSEFQSLGAAVWVGVDTSQPFEASGELSDSFFAGNDGLAIYDQDTLCPPCTQNHTTYERNDFDESSYGTKVFYNNRQPVPGVALTPAGLNSLVVDRGGGNTTNKSPGASNSTDSSWLPVGFIQSSPASRLSPTAVGDPNQNSESFTGWAWSGGCAELNGAPLASSFGFESSSVGVHTLMVFSGACVGSPDVDEFVTVLQGGSPQASLSASPIAIAGGESSTLSWSLPSGSFVSGLLSHEAQPDLPSAGGNAVVFPDETTRYHLFVLTEEGGAYDDAEVAVDDLPAELIFTDGFESGNTSMWSSST